jgi:hypothetical protein
MGHFTSQCLERKKKNKTQMTALTTVDEFSKSFEEDFCFITCMSSATVPNMWFINNAAFCHMTGCKEWLTRLYEGDIKLVIELGDDMTL